MFARNPTLNHINEAVDQDKEPGCKTCVNKSHAAAYAVLSYVTAYLKYHYPADYMCAVLSCTDNIEKVRSVLSDCREIGVKVLPPDINNSDLNYSVVDDAILFGLNSSKGTKIAYIKRLLMTVQGMENILLSKIF